MAIIDLIKSQLSPEFVSQAATQLGESESNVSKAVSGFFPAVLGGLADNADNPTILNTITNPSSSGLLGNLLGGTSDNSMISGLISSIFGDKLNGLLQMVSQYSGVSPASAGSLINSVTGATVGTVSKYASDNNLDAKGISNLLKQQKGLLSSLLPAGLSLGSLGLGSLLGGAKEGLTSATTKISGSVSDAKKEISGATNKLRSSGNGGGSFWKWLLPLLLLGVAAWFLWKQCENKENTKTDMATVEKDSATTPKDSAVVSASEKVSTEVVLPSGKKIKAYKGGVEDQLVQFLKSDEYKNATEDQLKAKWFNFDNLNFEFGTTKITAASQAQVDNLKAILTEFPAAKFKIGAYTDKVGDDKANEALSQKRADAVKAAVGSTQIVEAKGFGEQFAKVDEKASDKERESDRKTAIRLTK